MAVAKAVKINFGCVIVLENISGAPKLSMQVRHVTHCEITITLGDTFTNIYKILHNHVTLQKLFLVGCHTWLASPDTKHY